MRMATLYEDRFSETPLESHPIQKSSQSYSRLLPEEKEINENEDWRVIRRLVSKEYYHASRLTNGINQLINSINRLIDGLTRLISALLG